MEGSVIFDGLHAPIPASYTESCAQRLGQGAAGFRLPGSNVGSKAGQMQGSELWMNNKAA